MSKIRDKLSDTAHGAVPLIWWLTDSVIFCCSFLILVTIPLWWNPVSMTFGRDSALSVFLYSVGAFCIANLVAMILAVMDYRRQY